MKFSLVSMLPLLASWRVSAEPPSTAPAMSESAAKGFLSQGKTCCAALKLALPNRVSYAGSSAYNDSMASYWSFQEEDLRPTCVVSPTDSRDVALTIALLNIGGRILPGKCDFAVRSGGHTPFAGAANIQQGITVDLSGLKRVTPSKDLSTVTVGVGNRWGQVYSQLDTLGIAIGGGRVATVGVGGLTLGGGISFFSPRYGFVCDDVVRFEVVSASGVILNATQASHPDLFKALKGGSNNFGIVTEFESMAFEQGKFWGGSIVYDITTKDVQLAAFEALAGSPSYDPYAALINNYAFTSASNAWIISNNIEYTRPEENPTFFRNFTSLPQIYSTMRISNLTDFALEIAASSPSGRRQLMATATYANSANLMSDIFDAANATVQTLSHVPNLVYSLSFQPIPTAITSKAAARGGNSLGLSATDGTLFNALLSVSWDMEADDEIIEQEVKALFAKNRARASELGLFHEYEYLNYAADWQDPIRGYGAESVAHLRAVSRKYDPRGVFQKQVPGGFKLFD